jgi:DNA-directed RNA polymerase subunit RPC12/RpoP
MTAPVRLPRDYVCVKCGHETTVLLGEVAYRSPQMQYAPSDCAGCGSRMVRKSKHHKKHARKNRHRRAR